MTRNQTRSNRSLIALSALIFATSLGIAGVADAKGRGGHGRQGHDRQMRGEGRALAQLDLSDAQKSQLDELRQSQRTRTEPIRSELKVARTALRNATTADSVDEGAIRAASAQVAAAQADLAVARAQARSEMRSILTAEQRAKLDAMRAERQQRREDRKEQRDERRQRRHAETDPSSPGEQGSSVSDGDDFDL